MSPLLLLRRYPRTACVTVAFITAGLAATWILAPQLLGLAICAAGLVLSMAWIIGDDLSSSLISTEPLRPVPSEPAAVAAPAEPNIIEAAAGVIEDSLWNDLSNEERIQWHHLTSTPPQKQ